MKKTAIIMLATLFLSISFNFIIVEHKKEVIQSMQSYKVKYKIGNVTSERILKLYSESETEAIFQLKKQHNLNDSDNVIILSMMKI